ncbi:hypothetical protein [Xenorhabdus japonica]|uniref:Uncharacterized protein n=1 Tax=Xenorhabdus japonica TaxID=53341 RepID=A0A1I5EHY6_9GAMM|nr:hypothetical protein [Xenorhabdus japonica]SFO11129.1 hypothetical protein SAMN05421579_1722 [Xenorhabdus japonica]
MQGINSVTLSYPIGFGDSLSLRSPVAVVLTLAGHLAKLFAQFQSEKYFADGYTNIFGHLNNPLKNNQTPYLAFGHALAVPIISGQLPNSLIFSQTANMQSAYNLNAENIGMQTDYYLNRRKSSMQTPISDNRTLGVNDICSKTLRPSFSQAQKEKDSTANATLWRKANVLYAEEQQLKRLTSLRCVVSYCSTNLPSLRGGVNHVNNLALVNHRTNLIGYCSVESLDSMPLLSNSLRSRRLIHPALLSSPSSFIARPRRSDKSASRRNCTTILSFWFSLVDIGVFLRILNITVTNVHHCIPICKAMPRSALTLTRHLTNNDNYNIEVAMYKYTFLIGKGKTRLSELNPVRLITVLADCEGEARLLAGKSNLVFVSRQAWDIGIDTPFNCSDMSTVQGVNHA